MCVKQFAAYCFNCSSRIDTALFFFFFFNDTATTEIYTLSLHDALPISSECRRRFPGTRRHRRAPRFLGRSEEHTSELQSQSNLVCRLLLEKKKKKQIRARRPPPPSDFM